MITIASLKKEIEKLNKERYGLDPDNRVYKKIKKQVDFLTMCVRYLESGPTYDFLIGEQKRIKNRLAKIKEGEPRQGAYELKNDYSKRVREYNKTMDVPKAKNQLKAIEFLLEGKPVVV